MHTTHKYEGENKALKAMQDCVGYLDDKFLFVLHELRGCGEEKIAAFYLYFVGIQGFPVKCMYEASKQWGKSGKLPALVAVAMCIEDRSRVFYGEEVDEEGVEELANGECIICEAFAMYSGCFEDRHWQVTIKKKTDLGLEVHPRRVIPKRV